MASCIYAIIILILKWTFGAADLNTAKQALEYVYQVREGTCGAGTGEVLPLQFDVTAWNQYTDPAIRTANLLSKIIEINNGTLDSMSDEFFFLLVRNNVHGDSLIFGSAIAIEKGLYRKDNHHLPEIEEFYPIAKLPDGHWTVPYFDCGGGNVWMVTYSSPIFRVENGSLLFRGVATIDIELTYIDINQCDGVETDKSGLDVFRGTHRCQPTTMCIHEKGKGFVTGAYCCKCRKGYFFPNNTYRTLAYSGEEIESYFRQSRVIEPGKFQCAACATGCVTCLNDSPCLHYNNTILMICLLILTVISMLGIISIALFTYMNRKNNVIKSASSTFLELMCLGGILLCSQFLTSYFESTVLVCTLRIWPQHIGFFLLYGSLVIKTWRISQIFTVGARKRVHLPDRVLYKRLSVLMCVTVAILGAWTLSQPPEALPKRTSNNLLFYVCQFGPWEYAVISVEILMLLYGVYLCFKIRKAPTQYNDKYMTYAIYNAIILGIFMTFLSRLFLSVIGPDLTLVFQFLQFQVDASITLLIIFIPKFRAIRKKKEANQTSTSVASTTSNIQISTRFNRMVTDSVDLNVNVLKYMVERFDKATQTKWNTD